ncbi:OTU domain-containing protein [Cohnella sp. GCM10020058]|uniref:OTU domain-containing protein n=1 Tax=Cohnella sp. GCM10020058 TaxID=3317330 RepID=UPI003640A0D5
MERTAMPQQRLQRESRPAQAPDASWSREASKTSVPPGAASFGSQAQALLKLQQNGGNRAVMQMLRAKGAIPATSAPPIQRMRIVKDSVYREAQETDAAGDVVDTEKLSALERHSLTLEMTLEGNAELLRRIQREWDKDELDGESNLEELFELGSRIAELQQKKPEELEESDRNRMKEIRAEVAAARKFVEQNAAHPSVQVYKDVVISLARELVKAEGRSPGSRSDSESGSDFESAAPHAPDHLNLNVGLDERRNYREDMKKMGTWAGEAEAEVLADHLRIRAQVYVIVQGRFHRVNQVGANHAPVGELALVHLGNHYEVVDGVTDGMDVGRQRRWLKTSKTGDCLFESMLLIRHNGKPIDEDKKQQTILKLRKRTADNLSDDAIDETIHEMLVYGDTAGTGGHTSKLVKDRRGEAASKRQEDKEKRRQDHEKEKLVAKVDARYLQDKLDTYQTLEGLSAFGFDKAISAYLKARGQNPKSKETLAELRKLNDLFREAAFAFDKQKERADYEYRPFEKEEEESWTDELDRPQEEGERLELERKARERTLSRRDIKKTVSPNNANQTLIVLRGEEGEFAIDKLGQLVPRYSRRNISQANLDELNGKHSGEKGMYPSRISPVPDADRSQVASGIGSNKIRAESDEMHHVQGHKPSDYLSVTAKDEDALNPKGKTFEAAATVVVDLSYIDPDNLSALYTSLGMRYFLLDGMTGGDKGETIGLAVREQSKDSSDGSGEKEERKAGGKKKKEKKEAKPSSNQLAVDHNQLSAKEWQALLDVIRTKEVLIEGMIPPEAVRKL